MGYKEEDIYQLDDEVLLWVSRKIDLGFKLFSYSCSHHESEVMIRHGLIRRMSMMEHCLHSVFEAIPPDSERVTDDSRHDAEAFIHSFIVNTYGCLDNIARIWCLEAGIANKNGAPLKDRQIGFGKKHKEIRQSLPEKFGRRVKEMDEWMNYLVNYRDALAHRVPLYIPPQVISNLELPTWNMIGEEIALSIRTEDSDKYDSLEAKQAALGSFQPVMCHSLGSTDRDSMSIFFHSQMICDLATVVELGEHLYEAISKLEPSPA